jgi:RNA polymerase sigma factor (sigma-70 family)
MERCAAERLVNDLFDSWYAAAVRYARHLRPSSQSAEDLVQEAFFLLYRDLRAGKPIDSPRAWTLGVIRRLAGHEIWRHAHQQISFVGLDVLEALPKGHILPEEPEIDLMRFLGALTDRESQVVLLRMDSLTYREIGEELEISSKSVCTLLSRALKKLRKMFGQQCREELPDHVEIVAQNPLR